MTTEDSFEAMNREGLQQFEETYGTEARERYGNDAIDASNEPSNTTREPSCQKTEILAYSFLLTANYLPLSFPVPHDTSTICQSEGQCLLKLVHISLYQYT